MNNHTTRVLITIDTEFSIGGYFANQSLKPVPADRHIYCKISGKDYGINLIMDILEKYGLKGVFFLETEARHYFGEEEIISIAKHIQDRGNEIQLHTHPNYRSFTEGRRVSDDMRRFPCEGQAKIIRESLEFLCSYGFRDILAYRSGGFYSNLDTIKALENSGVRYSANYNLANPNCSYIEKYPLRNDIFRIGDVFEVPVTCFKELQIRKEWNSFQLSALSFDEFKCALEFYRRIGTNVVCLLTHSFEFVRAYDIQFSKMIPNKVFINRFDNICRYLADNDGEYKVINYEELDQLVNNNGIVVKEKLDDFYKSPFLKTSRRYFENGVLSKITK